MGFTFYILITVSKLISMYVFPFYRGKKSCYENLVPNCQCMYSPGKQCRLGMEEEKQKMKRIFSFEIYNEGKIISIVCSKFYTDA